jgi:hypothetical protein
MRGMSLPSLLAGLLFCAGPESIRAGDPPPPKDDDHVHAKIELHRPDPAVDTDAEGHLHLKEHHGRSAIQIHVHQLDPGATYAVQFKKGANTENAGQITIPVHEENPHPAKCFQAELSGDQEVPAVDTDATGKAKFRLEGPDRSVLHYEIRVKGLSGPATAAHIHPGARGAEGPPLITLDEKTLHGKVDITAEQVAALESGNTYVNVHTGANPDGEIRGQIAVCPKPSPPPPHGNGRLRIDTKHGDKLPLGAASLSDLVGATVSILNAANQVVLTGDIDSLEKPKPAPPPPHCFAAALSGDQEVPAVDTDANGKARFNLEGPDRTMLHYEIKVEGLSGPPTAAHIHPGAKGAEGPPLITLDEKSLRGEIQITPEQVAALESGNTYVNVHTGANPDGEIRGQIAACEPKPKPGGGEVEGEFDEDGSSLVGSDFFFDEFDFDEPLNHDATFRRGDANSDGFLDLADVVSTIAILYQGAPLPYCPDALDSDDDGRLAITDAITILLNLFGGQGPLPPPGTDGRAGFDPTGDDLLCNDKL